MVLGGLKIHLNFIEDFIENYNEDSDKGYFFEFDLQYAEELHELHNYLPFLLKIMKIGKVEKLLANMYDKKEIKPSIKKLSQA